MHSPGIFCRSAIYSGAVLCVLLACGTFTQAVFAKNAVGTVAKQQIAIPVNLSDGFVARCFDGDTLQLTDRRIVRLAGIDCPEGASEKNKAQYYAKEARQELNRLVLNKKVRLISVGTINKDRYGRIVADVQLENGQSLSDIMISKGAAFFYPHLDHHAIFQQRLSALQKKAITAKRGLWAHLLSLPLARKNYTGNQESLRFFTADCPEAQHIKPRNRVYFGTLMDAFLAGYAPARICLFWPTVP